MSNGGVTVGNGAQKSHFFDFFEKLRSYSRINICVNNHLKKLSTRFFSSDPIISADCHRENPCELRIPILVFYNVPKRLRYIFKSGDFRDDRAKAQKRLETAILAYFENL